MSRRDYVAVARILRAAADRADLEDSEGMRQYIRDQLAIMFQQDNEHFDVDRFMKAAG